MKKQCTPYRKSAIYFSLLSMFVCVTPDLSQAQQTILNQRDSISYTTNIDILNKQFLIAGDLYKIKKYKLAQRSKIDADSLFRQCVEEYQKIFSVLPELRQQHFFSEKFYTEVIPVIQYFRNAYLITLFETDRQRLYPREAPPDPKHHEHDSSHDHIEQ